MYRHNFLHWIIFISYWQNLQIWMLVKVCWCITNKTSNVYINVTLRCICITIVALETNKYYIFWVCVYSLSHPAFKAHAPYYSVICGLSGSTILFHIISYMAPFLEKFIEHKVCFDFVYKFYLKICHSKKNSARYNHKCT